MAFSRNSEAIDDLLAFTMTDDVRKQDKVFPLAYMSFSRFSRRKNWDFVCSNWQQLYGMFDGGFLVNWIAKTAAKFNTLKDAKEVENFFNSVRESSPAANRAMDQTVEEIKVTGTWRERDLDAMKQWLLGSPYGNGD